MADGYKAAVRGREHSKRWYLTDDDSRICETYDRDPSGVIWVTTTKDLVSALEQRNPAPEGFSHVRKSWDHVVVLDRPETDENLPMTTIFKIAKDSGSVLTVSGEQIRSIMPNVHKDEKNIWPHGGFIIRRKYGKFRVEHNPRAAKSLRTRRANSSRRKGDSPPKVLRRMPLLDTMRSLVQNLNHGAWRPTGCYIWAPHAGLKTDLLDSCAHAIVKLSKVWRITYRGIPSYRNTKWFKKFMEDSSAFEPRVDDGIAEKKFAEWLKTERNVLKRTKKGGRRKR